MYAQLCHQLCEDAPNFENSSSNISTFRRLLLNKCQDEFENRSKATDVFDTKDGTLTDEELEQYHLAKRKMLGNIKFIGELGKLEMLHEGILHRCIKQLLEKKKNIPLREMAEDLECLCQIMTTVGRRLDTPKAKAWMDQYFSRIKWFSNSPELPSRIRFMLQDVVDLRENKLTQWIPRSAGWDHGPKTITAIRQEAANETGVYIPQHRNMGGQRMNGNYSPQMKSLPGGGGAFGDFFGISPSGMMGTLGTGPGVIQMDGYMPTTNFNNKPRNNQQNQGYNNYNKRPENGSPRSGRHNFQGQQTGGGGGRLSPQQQQQQQSQQFQSKAKATLPPRLARLQQQQQQQVQQHQPHQTMIMQTDSGLPIPLPNMSVPPPSVKEEINLRPNRNFTTALRPSVPTMLPKSAQAAPSTGPPLMPGPPYMTEQRANNLNPLLAKQAAVTIKQVPQEKLMPTKKKSSAPSKDEAQKATENMLTDYLNGGELEEALKVLKELNAPRKFFPDLLSRMIKTSLEKSESERESVAVLIVAMNRENLITSDMFMDGFKAVLDKMSGLETDVPLVRSYVAKFGAQAVAESIITLTNLSEPMVHGTHYPLFLICLQQLLKLKDKDWVINMFNESKLDLQTMLPEIDRNKERMMEILEERGLSFIFPLLRVQSELWKAIEAEPTAAAVFKWVKDKVDTSVHHSPGFINILTTSLLRYITKETTLAKGEDPTQNPEKPALDKEKELLNNMKGVLQQFLHDKPKIQIHALYAAQVFSYNNQFPKGMLLRLFMYYYDMEIVDEDVFLKWKEEVNDEFPGKGKALFQVNQWLTWLEQAEEESDEGDEE